MSLIDFDVFQLRPSWQTMKPSERWAANRRSLCDLSFVCCVSTARISRWTCQQGTDQRENRVRWGGQLTSGAAGQQEQCSVLIGDWTGERGLKDRR